MQDINNKCVYQKVTNIIINSLQLREIIIKHDDHTIANPKWQSYIFGTWIIQAKPLNRLRHMVIFSQSFSDTIDNSMAPWGNLLPCLVIAHDRWAQIIKTALDSTINLINVVMSFVLHKMLAKSFHITCIYIESTT